MSKITEVAELVEKGKAKLVGAAVQAASCINMLYFMYLWIPMIINLIITIFLSRLKVEHANALIREKN